MRNVSNSSKTLIEAFWNTKYVKKESGYSLKNCNHRKDFRLGDMAANHIFVRHEEWEMLVWSQITRFVIDYYLLVEKPTHIVGRLISK